MIYSTMYMGGVLVHHGIQGMHWGVRNGPPYPIKGNKKFHLTKKEIEDIITIKKSLSYKDKKALNMTNSNDYETTGSKCFIEYENKEPVAYCLIDIDDNNDADISVACSSKFRGKGYALKVLKKGIKWSKKNCNKTYYATKSYNTASQKLAKKAGLNNIVRDDKKWKTFLV